MLEANERLEEEDPGSEGEPSVLGNTRYLRQGTGGNSCDGGDVSGGVMMDRENEGWRLSEGRSTSFLKEGRMPVVSVIPLGRVRGRGPSVLLLFDRSWVAEVGAVTRAVIAGLGVETSFMDTFRNRVFNTSDCAL